MANVNVPTDVDQKEKDVNAKLQLYGIYSAFANGKVPSNKQIDVALNSALASKPLAQPSKKLSAEGQKLVADLREVIKQAKYLLLTKNQGNLIQQFVWDAQHIDGANATLPGAPTDKDTAKQHGDQALDGLKTLGTLILSNGQFRKLLNDATILIRDMAGDAAQNAANKVNPSDEQLNQIDRPADDNTWHDVPDLSAGNIKAEARSAYDKNKPFSKQEAKDAANQGVAAAQNQPTNQDAGAAGAQTAKDNLKSTAEQNLPEQTKETAQNAKNAAVQSSKNYLSKKMPKERREQTVWRLKKMITEIQGHPDYQQAIETLLSLAETYSDYAKDVSKDSTGTVQGAHDDHSLRSVETNLKTLIERFANSTSTDDLWDSIKQVYRDADQDPELKNWFKSVNRFIRTSLQEQGYVLRDESTEEWNRLYDKGNFLLRERYRDHTNRVLDEIKFLADQFEQDPQNKAFGDAVEKLFLDLGNDENGKTTFKPHLVKDVFEVIIPGIFESTRYVPIPRIEVSDPMVDVVVENLVVESDNLFPNVFEFATDNYFRMGRKNIASKNDNRIKISASGIQCDLRDVAYYIKKKQGFPSITDKGVMDIILAGDGFGFELKGRNAQKKDRTHFVVVEKVDVSIKSLQIKIKKSNHKLLFSIAKPLLLKVMRPVIQKVIEKQVKQAFEDGDAFLYSIHQDAERAINSAKNDPENAPNNIQQYINAIQARIGEKKEKAQAKAEKAKERAAETKVNVAITQHDSIFQNISLPGGISTKATKYKELAAKGDRWESPVFGIGSAAESTDIPKLTEVRRKPHQTTTATVRGGNHPNSATSSTGGTGYNTSGGPGYATSGAPGYSTTGGPGYATTTGAPGYSTTGGPGYATTTGALGYSTTGGPGYATTTGAPTGFGTEVDQAFGGTTGASQTKTYYDGVTNQ